MGGGPLEADFGRVGPGREGEGVVPLLGFVKEHKVRYKWLAEVEFAEEVPKSPTGKLLRRVLKLREKDGGRVKGVVVKEEGRERAKL